MGEGRAEQDWSDEMKKELKEELELVLKNMTGDNGATDKDPISPDFGGGDYEGE